MSRAARAAIFAFGWPASAARKRTDRDRLEVSTRSRSMNARRPIPRSARPLMTSFPRAPAPTTTTRAPERRDCCHHSMSPKRENRSSGFTATPRSCGDLRLQPEHVARADVRVAEALGVEELPPRVLVMELVAHELPIGTLLRQLHLLDQHHQDAVHRRVVG